MKFAIAVLFEVYEVLGIDDSALSRVIYLSRCFIGDGEEFAFAGGC